MACGQTPLPNGLGILSPSLQHILQVDSSTLQNPSPLSLDRKCEFRRAFGANLHGSMAWMGFFVSRQAKSSTRVRLVAVARGWTSQLEFSSGNPWARCRDSLEIVDALLLGDWIWRDPPHLSIATTVTTCLHPIPPSCTSFLLLLDDMSYARWWSSTTTVRKAYVVYTRAMCFHCQYRVESLDQ